MLTTQVILGQSSPSSRVHSSVTISRSFENSGMAVKALQAKQVERMMASPRIEAGVRAFFVDNFGFDEFETLTKDTALFPKFSAQAAEDAQEQTLKTIVDLVVTNGGDYRDIKYEVSTGEDAGIAKITINRPEKRNAFRPQTVQELLHAFEVARDDQEIGVVVLTGQGDWAFCSGGDQMIRGDDGYIGDDAVAHAGIGRLNVLDLQIAIRTIGAMLGGKGV